MNQSDVCVYGGAGAAVAQLLWRDFYSAPVITAPEAAREFRMPDLKQLPSLVPHAAPASR